MCTFSWHNKQFLNTLQVYFEAFFPVNIYSILYLFIAIIAFPVYSIGMFYNLLNTTIRKLVQKVSISYGLSILITTECCTNLLSKQKTLNVIMINDPNESNNSIYSRCLAHNMQR